MADKLADGTLTGRLADARLPSVDQRSDPPNFAATPDEDDPALRDISTILLGAQAISGKALTSAGRMTVSEEARHALRDQQTREDRQARELASLARWNTQMTTVGGVQMTNEQAQNARRNVIDNGDAYADWAVRKGLIREDQKEEFKQAAKRKHELEEKRGRGTLTPEEAEEARRLEQSGIGKAIDAATAHNYQSKGVAPSAETTKPSMDVALRGSADVAMNRPALFQSAPDASAAFETASSPAFARKPVPVPPTSPSIKATGLDL